MSLYLIAKIWFNFGLYCSYHVLSILSCKNEHPLNMPYWAWLITDSSKYDHITLILFDLYWLSVSECIKFKTILLAHKSSSPKVSYLHSRTDVVLFSIKNVGVIFNTTSESLFALILLSYCSRAFAVSAPELPNKLPSDICSCDN